MSLTPPPQRNSGGIWSGLSTSQSMVELAEPNLGKGLPHLGFYKSHEGDPMPCLRTEVVDRMIFAVACREFLRVENMRSTRRCLCLRWKPIGMFSDAASCRHLEMVPEGGHCRGRRKVDGAFLQIREADPQDDLVFGCFVRSGWGVVPGDWCVLEMKLVRGEVKKTYAQGWGMWVSWRFLRVKENWLGGT